MERTKKASEAEEVQTEEPKYRWRVTGDKPFHGMLNGKTKIYKPGEVFIATESQVPTSFRDIIQKVDAQTVQELEKKLPGKVPTYVAVPTGKKNDEEEDLYNVENHNKKVLNQKPLTLSEANNMISDLIG